MVEKERLLEVLPELLPTQVLCSEETLPFNLRKVMDVLLIYGYGQKREAGFGLLKSEGTILDCSGSGKKWEVPDNVTHCTINLNLGLLLGSAQKSLQEFMVQGIRSGLVRPLPDRPKSMLPQVVEGGDLGKCLSSVSDLEFILEAKSDSIPSSELLPQTWYSSELSFLVFGGGGGIGTELCNYLVEHGVRKLFIVSRTGRVDGFQELRMRKWREARVHVEVVRLDIGTEGDVLSLFQHSQSIGPIGGIFNLAMVKHF
jgi:hypothetical protein